MPITLPVTLSAWLIGGGAAVAVLGLLLALFDARFNLVDVLLLVAFIGVVAYAFVSASLPALPHRAVATLVVTLIGFGVGADRVGFGFAMLGDLLLFLGAAAAAAGAVIAETGLDQPLGGPGA